VIRLDFRPAQRQLRQFALACPIGFGLIGWIVQRAGGQPWWPFAGLALGLVLMAVGLARPLALRPLYVAILLVAAPIGWVVSNLIAAAFFFLLLVPLGLFFRLIGRDALGLRGRALPTYWRETRTTADPRSYYRQG